MTDISNLSRRNKRPKEPLEDVPDPEPIVAERFTGIPAGATGNVSSGSGIASPLTETSNTGIYTLSSSDGLFTFEIPVETTYEDDNGLNVVVVHKEP